VINIKKHYPGSTVPSEVIFTIAMGKQLSSWYPEKGHLLFMYLFLEAICGIADNNGDRKITIGEVSDFVGDDTN
jgi:hypothetical protein